MRSRSKMLNVTNVKRYDYGYTKQNYLNNLNRKTGESISLQSSPIHQSNPTNYSRSTNSTPQHFYVNHLNEEDTNLDDYLEENSSSLEDLNGELNNQNSSNDEYDNNSEESNENCTKVFDKRFKFNNQIASKLYNQTFIKHSRSYQNEFFELDASSPRPLDKPTSLSLSGNNLSNLNNDQQSPGRKKFEMYIMTGDFILNLSKTNSEENPMVDDITHFEGNKGGLNKQKIRELKEEKRKLVTRVPSNSMKNCVTNSDQMRECLSPEIKISNFDRTNQLDLFNDTISKQLNELKNEEENLIVSTEEDENSSEKLSKIEILPSAYDSSDDQPDELAIESNESPIHLDELSPQTDCLFKTTEINNLPAAEEDVVAGKRYPTFIQQTDNSIEEQSMNLHQKSTIDEASAKRLARRLFNLDKFRKIDVSRHLSKNNEFNKAVASEYCNFFDFTEVDLLTALRKFLSKFYLIGETQERERILYHFAKRFFTCNPTVHSSIDAIYTLTCSIMLLNQDLHGECVSKKMSLNDFIDNLKSLNSGQNFDRELLKELYNKIKNEKLEWCNDENEFCDDSFNNGSLATSNTILEIPNPSNSIEYKRGYIMRKRCLQANGKKVSLGKRKWRLFYAVLRDTVLYLHKDDQSLMKSQIYDSVKNSIRIHHAVAFVANEYTKRKFVLRLCTADGSEYLISLNSKAELDSWIETINIVAACLSAPPTSIIQSERKKYPLKSVLPVNNTTKYQFKEQLNDHESRRIRIHEEIQDMTSQLRLNYNLVEKKAKNTVLQLRYLKHEYERYTAYCKVMKKVKQNPNGILEKASKSQLSSLKSKPLTNLIIGEEPLDDTTKSSDD